MTFFILPAMAQRYTKENISDSLSGKWGSNDITIKMNVDYPDSENKNNQVCDAIRNWLLQFIIVDKEMELPQYTGDIKDGNALIRHYLKAYVEKNCQQDTTNAWYMSYELSAKCVYETNKYISYRVDSYDYQGGAHGMPYTGYAIFRKADGHILSWRDMLKQGGTPTLRRLLARGVMKYLEAPNWAQAKASLFLEAPHNTMTTFPLPSSNPGLTAKGIAAVYQSYEIGPYAIGRPEVTIPRSLFTKLLKPTVIADMHK